MRTLADEDVHALSAVIQALRGPIRTDAFATVALEAAARLVRADIWTWNEIDHDAATALARRLPDRELDAQSEARLVRFGELLHQHPVVRHVTNTGDGSAHMISDFISSDQFHELDIYREVYVGEKVEHQISITLPAVLPRIVAVVANRSTLGDEFDERDRLMLNLLRPHLAQSYELARERRRLHRMLGAATAGLRADGAHLIVLDRDPYELTHGAMTVLYRAFGPPGEDDPLPRRVSSWLQRERSRAARRDELPDIRRPLVTRRHSRRTELRLVPGDGEISDVLLLREDEANAELVEQRLPALGLTDREADILRQVAAGHTNATIAVALFVEPSTVKSHLENIYRKLGVRSRAAAVAMASDLLAADIRRSAD